MLTSGHPPFGWGRILIVLALAFASGSPIAGAAATDVDARPVVLVTGATGRQGGAVARELLQRGYRVRALTRDPESVRANALAELGIDTVEGDFGRPESLLRAMRGVDGVFAVTDFWEHGFEEEIRHGQNLVDAAVEAGVSFFVYSSVGSADRDTNIPHFESKWRIEQYLQSSGIEYAIVRPVSFMENWTLDDAESDEIVMAGTPTKPHQYISVCDIGYFVANAFDSPGAWGGVAVDIAGDEISMQDISRLLSEITGRSIAPTRIGWDEYEKRFGEELRIMSEWFENVGYDVDVEELRRQNPDLVTMEQYLRGLPIGRTGCLPQ